MLLETIISRDDGYQKQQGWILQRCDFYALLRAELTWTFCFADTLIVWTDVNSVDMALSFQEAEGCAAIW